MGDSPLSIVASVTGILTFTAAILAFIYARYLTLRNSRAEMVKVFFSITTSLQEGASVHVTIQDTDLRHWFETNTTRPI